MIKKSLIAIISVLFFLLPGCGYRLSGGGVLPGNVTRVSVSMFQNQSFETGAETIFTSALIRTLVEKTDARIVARKEADAVITSTIKSITMGALTRTSGDAVIERLVGAVLDLYMVNKEGETIWSVRNFSQTEVYTVSSINASDEAAKREALEKIADRISERIISKMRDNF